MLVLASRWAVINNVLLQPVRGGASLRCANHALADFAWQSVLCATSAISSLSAISDMFSLSDMSVILVVRDVSGIGRALPPLTRPS